MAQNKKFNDSLLVDQISGAFVTQINTARDIAMNTALDKQDYVFKYALEQLYKVRDFVSKPNNILGSMQTKHGEVAEQLEVGIRNAQQVLNQNVSNNNTFSATFDGVGRLAPEDYLIDGVQVQSKFINGINNNLTHVLDHMKKYTEFSRGENNSYYHIPKDTYEIITRINNGEDVPELSKRTINAIKDKVLTIELESGKPFSEVVQPGMSTYAEPQLGNVEQTLNNHEGRLDAENKEIKDNIISDHRPSLAEAGQAALIGGAVGASLSLTTALYVKYKQGKTPFSGNFNADDWKEVGIDTSKGAAIGAISSAAIYGLTNYAEIGAPFAGAIVSAFKGVSALVAEYNQGKISFEEFYQMGLVICSESAIVGTCTAIGQTMIPVPILGAVIGSIAGKILCESAKYLSSKIQARMDKELVEFKKKIDESSIKLLDEIDRKFDHLGKLTVAAFDFSNNEKLVLSSIALAQEYGVANDEIIHNHDELDAFMLG